MLAGRATAGQGRGMDGLLTNSPVLGILLATLAGLSIPVGAFLAQAERFLPDWSRTELRHTVIAVGGGALLSAVALVLLPEAAERLAALPLLTAFVAGGVVFFLLDRALHIRKRYRTRAANM